MITEDLFIFSLTLFDNRLLAVKGSMAALSRIRGKEMQLGTHLDPSRTNSRTAAAEFP